MKNPPILLSDLIHIKKGVLTSNECDVIIAEREDRNNEQETEQCDNAITGVYTHSTFQQVSLIPNTKNFDIVHKACQETIDEWTDTLKKKDSFGVKSLKEALNFSHVYRLMRYDVGGWIHPHIDWTHGVVGSLTIALSKPSDFEGGKFKFFNGNHSVNMEKGDALIFPANSFFVHEVTEVTKGSRYSVNSFLTSIPLNNINQINQYINEVVNLEQENPIRYE